jgi:hypothetical protein
MLEPVRINSPKELSELFGSQPFAFVILTREFFLQYNSSLRKAVQEFKDVAAVIFANYSLEPTFERISLVKKENHEIKKDLNIYNWNNFSYLWWAEIDKSTIHSEFFIREEPTDLNFPPLYNNVSIEHLIDFINENHPECLEWFLFNIDLFRCG